MRLAGKHELVKLFGDAAERGDGDPVEKVGVGSGEDRELADERLGQGVGEGREEDLVARRPRSKIGRSGLAAARNPRMRGNR